MIRIPVFAFIFWDTLAYIVFSSFSHQLCFTEIYYFRFNICSPNRTKEVLVNSFCNLICVYCVTIIFCISAFHFRGLLSLHRRHKSRKFSCLRFRKLSTSVVVVVSWKAFCHPQYIVCEIAFLWMKINLRLYMELECESSRFWYFHIVLRVP